jgi:hypothetical protein
MYVGLLDASEHVRKNPYVTETTTDPTTDPSRNVSMPKAQSINKILDETAKCLGCRILGLLTN